MGNVGLSPILPPECELSCFALPPFPLLDSAISKPSCFELLSTPSEVAVKVTDLLTVHECLQSGAVESSVPMGENNFSRASEENICSEGIRECLFTAEKDQIWGHVACRRSSLKLLANIQKKKSSWMCLLPMSVSPMSEVSRC